MGEGVRLSIIVPTTGRETLAATLASISNQMNPVDELILVWDKSNSSPCPIELAETFADVYLEVDSEGDETGRGNVARRKGIEFATGTHLAFIDDDDCYLEGALGAMRAGAHPTKPVIFRMRHIPFGNVIIPFENQWGELKFGNVGTPCFLVPNIPDALGYWAAWDGNAGSDFRFLSESCEKMGAPIWKREIIAIVRPHEVVPSG